MNQYAHLLGLALLRGEVLRLRDSYERNRKGNSGVLKNCTNNTVNICTCLSVQLHCYKVRFNNLHMHKIVNLIQKSLTFPTLNIFKGEGTYVNLNKMG